MNRHLERSGMRISHLILAGLVLMLLAARPVAGADSIEIDAPGGLWYERDGSIGARGTPNKPLVIRADGYEITAQSLQYDQRNQTGRASGGVIWRDRRPGASRELNADAITFVLSTKTGQAEGHVRIKENTAVMEAGTARVDMAKGTVRTDRCPGPGKCRPTCVHRRAHRVRRRPIAG